MSNTATNYINLIRKDYPVRGKDNDSQGFRDNFTNISKALETINSDVSTLGNIAVLSNTTATFYGNNIEEANLKNCSTELWDNGILGGNVFIDFTQGSYQKLTVSSGVNLVTIINWPEEGTAGHMMLAVYPAFDTGVYQLQFTGDNITSIGPAKNPYFLQTGINLFEIYSEYAAGSQDRIIHTRLVNEAAITSSSGAVVTTGELTLTQNKFSASSNIKFSIGTTTGSVQALTGMGLVPKLVSTGNFVTAISTTMIGNVAYVANKVTTQITTAGIFPLTGATNNYFEVVTVEGIQPGATFGLPDYDMSIPNSTKSFRVTKTDPSNNRVYCSPEFSNPNVGTNYYITFRNPLFGDVINGEQYGEKTAFPTLITLLDGPDYIKANTSTGRIGVFRGSLYASANTLEITFQDYGGGIKNTFTASTMVSNSPATVSSATCNDGTDLANTRFVHDILPAGSIIMWYGVPHYNNIPTGWVLCDGREWVVKSYDGTTATIRTPNLADKFVVGANNFIGSETYNKSTATSTILGTAHSTSTGGTAVAAIVAHNHVSTGTFISPPHNHSIDDPGHSHVLTDRAGVLAGDGVARADIDSDDRICLFGSYDLVKNSKSAETGIIIENSTTIIAANLQVLHTGTNYQDTFHTRSGQPVLEGNNVANIPPFVAVCYIMKITGYRVFPRND